MCVSGWRERPSRWMPVRASSGRSLTGAGLGRLSAAAMSSASSGTSGRGQVEADGLNVSKATAARRCSGWVRRSGRLVSSSGVDSTSRGPNRLRARSRRAPADMEEADEWRARRDPLPARADVASASSLGRIPGLGGGESPVLAGDRALLATAEALSAGLAPAEETPGEAVGGTLGEATESASPDPAATTGSSDAGGSPRSSAEAVCAVCLASARSRPSTMRRAAPLRQSKKDVASSGLAAAERLRHGATGDTTRSVASSLGSAPGGGGGGGRKASKASRRRSSGTRPSRGWAAVGTPTPVGRTARGASPSLAACAACLERRSARSQPAENSRKCADHASTSGGWRATGVPRSQARYVPRSTGPSAVTTAEPVSKAAAKPRPNRVATAATTCRGWVSRPRPPTRRGTACAAGRLSPPPPAEKEVERRRSCLASSSSRTCCMLSAKMPAIMTARTSWGTHVA
mmetsp:Transcript_20453/g.78590  ORF Transcript_20453/g.78590 Transcript_20453/m.78590 type:complete len:461 (+) Transcript_20453:1421-2803(+)